MTKKYIWNIYETFTVGAACLRLKLFLNSVNNFAELSQNDRLSRFKCSNDVCHVAVTCVVVCVAFSESFSKGIGVTKKGDISYKKSPCGVGHCVALYDVCGAYYLQSTISRYLSDIVSSIVQQCHVMHRIIMGISHLQQCLVHSL